MGRRQSTKRWWTATRCWRELGREGPPPRSLTEAITSGKARSGREALHGAEAPALSHADLLVIQDVEPSEIITDMYR